MACVGVDWTLTVPIAAKQAGEHSMIATQRVIRNMNLSPFLRWHSPHTLHNVLVARAARQGLSQGCNRINQKDEYIPSVQAPKELYGTRRHELSMASSASEKVTNPIAPAVPAVVAAFRRIAHRLLQ